MKRSYLLALAVPLLLAASAMSVEAQSTGDDEIVTSTASPPAVSAAMPSFSVSEIMNTFATMPAAQEVAFALIVALSAVMLTANVRVSRRMRRGSTSTVNRGGDEDEDGSRQRLYRSRYERVAGLPVVQRPPTHVYSLGGGIA